MLSRIAALFLLLIGVHFYIFYTTDFQQPKRENAYSIAAKPKEIEGDVRVRVARQPNWLRMSYVTNLYGGDKIYVGKNSYVKLEYEAGGATVVVPENSLFQVKHKPQPMSKMRRVFFASAPAPRAEGKGLSSTRMFVRMERMPGRDYLDQGQQEATPSGSPKDQFAFSRTTRMLRLRQPQGDIPIAASRFPLVLSVTVEPANTDKLYAYLWRKNGSAKPLWSSVNAQGNFEVPLTEPGKFIFQAVSEDDAYVTPGLVIEAVPETEKSLLANNLFAHWKGRKTLVLR